MSNFILGAGINGLLCGYLLKDFKIIGYSKQAQEATNFPLGPRFLHFSVELKALLKELKLPTDIKVIKVGYYYKGALHDDCPEDLRQQYFNKTRGKFKPFGSSMSANKNKINVFSNTSPKKLYNKLYKIVKSKIIEERVTDINRNEKLLFTSNYNEFKYNKLISTIPAPAFYYVCKQPLIASTFKANPKHFYLIDKFINLGSYEYVYFPEADNKIDRVSVHNDKLVAESSKKLNDETNFKIYLRLKINNLQIANNINVVSNDIKFIGRYACWNHSKKINEVLNDIKNLCN